jgi:predicted restriction endonuclease
VSIIALKRYQKIVKMLKNKYNHKCQLCGYSFHMDNGDYYCEAHHIKELAKGGSQDPNNVIILCSNHHRQFHYAKDRITISELTDGEKIIEIDGQKYYMSANRN